VSDERTSAAARTVADLRVPRLADAPAVARLAVGLAWIAVAFVTSSPVAIGVLLAVAVGVLVVAAGAPLSVLLRAALPYVVIGALVVGTWLILALLTGRPEPATGAGMLALRLLVVVAVVLGVFAPSDAEQLVAELIVLLRVPPRVAYGLLAFGRALGGMPDAWRARRQARRARGVRRGGPIAMLVEPAAAVALQGTSSCPTTGGRRRRDRDERGRWRGALLLPQGRHARLHRRGMRVPRRPRDIAARDARRCGA
jgi:hypothetical protein